MEKMGMRVVFLSRRKRTYQYYMVWSFEVVPHILPQQSVELRLHESASAGSGNRAVTNAGVFKEFNVDRPRVSNPLNPRPNKAASLEPCVYRWL